MEQFPTDLLKELHSAATAKGTSNLEILAGVALIMLERLLEQEIANREGRGK